MLTVNDDVSTVEVDLAGGRVGCPDCGGQLRPWGSARVRRIRESLTGTASVVAHRPRRARCRGCRATHVLLPHGLAARRADGAAVIAAAIEAKQLSGHGHRAIARGLGRPGSTVRGWLRSFASSAQAIAGVFAAAIARHAPDAAALWPGPARGGGRALAMLAAWARVVAVRLGVVEVAWQQAAMVACHGRLFCASWWAGGGQHEPALTQAGEGAAGSR